MSRGYLPVQLRGLYVAQPMGFAAGEEEEVSLPGETCEGLC